MSESRPLVAVVDDDGSVRTAIQRLLRSAKMDVEAIASGEAFLDSLRDHRPDCVVLDLHMPGTNGFEVLTRMAADGSDVPVIVITGHDSPEAYERAMAAGAQTYLRKPVDDESLLEALRRATGREGAKHRGGAQ